MPVFCNFKSRDPQLVDEFIPDMTIVLQRATMSRWQQLQKVIFTDQDGKYDTFLDVLSN